MSKKASPTLVGLFVLGAILIAVGAIVFLGTTRLFTKEKKCVCFFRQSVTGLQVGAAVKFKGVPIGQVTKIQIRFDPDATSYVKILFRINTDTVVNNLGVDIDLLNETQTRKQEERGLRATLCICWGPTLPGMRRMVIRRCPPSPPKWKRSWLTLPRPWPSWARLTSKA